MTDQELKEYYSGLLIAQYKEKPKAKATIEALAGPIVMNQMPLAVQDAFQVDSAIGVQLDVIGKYVGASRTVTGPNKIKVTLDDADFRILVKIAIVKTHSSSSLYEIESLLAQYFPNQIVITDNATMQINYFISNEIGSTDLQYAITYGDYLPRPMGVEVAVVVVPPLTDNYFGFITYLTVPTNISPFNTYEFYSEHSPWLQYTT